MLSEKEALEDESHSSLLDKETNDKLSSLLKYLDNIEFENNDKKPNSDDGISILSNRDGNKTNEISGKNDETRTWIWDTLGTSTDSNTKDLNENTPHHNNAKKVPSYTTSDPLDQSQCHNPVNEIGTMESELSELNIKVARLQASLNEKKEGCAGKIKQLNDRWSQRIQKHTNAHEKTIKSQEDFNAQVKKSCEDMINTEKNLDEEIKGLIASQNEKYDSVKAKCDKNIEKSQKLWADEEKKTFKELLRAKSKDLKRDAAKALEPELLQLMSRHKSELQALRTDMLFEVDRFKADSEKQRRSQIEAETERMNQSRTQEEEELEKKHSIYISQITNEHMDEIKEMRTKWRSNMEADQKKFENERNKKVMEFEREIKSFNEDSAMLYNKLNEEHKSELKVLHKEEEKKMRKFKEEYEKSTTIWKKDYEKQLRLEFDESEREEKKKIQEGFNKEFHDISNKLQSEVNEKRELAKRDNEIKMREIQETNELEFERLETITKESKKRFDENLQHQNTLEQKVATLRLELKQIEKENHDTEAKINESELQLDKMKLERSSREDKLRLELTGVLESQKLKLKSLEKDLHLLVEKGNEKRNIEEEELKKIKQNQKDEIDSVNNRVKRLLEGKQKQANALAQTLVKMKEEEDKLQKIIDKSRADKILG